MPVPTHHHFRDGVWLGCNPDCTNEHGGLHVLLRNSSDERLGGHAERLTTSPTAGRSILLTEHRGQIQRLDAVEVTRLDGSLQIDYWLVHEFDADSSAERVAGVLRELTRTGLSRCSRGDTAEARARQVLDQIATHFEISIERLQSRQRVSVEAATSGVADIQGFLAERTMIKSVLRAALSIEADKRTVEFARLQVDSLNADLQARILMQLYTLASGAREAAEMESTRSEKERQSDRRLAVLGAGTLFPLLLLSLLGANVIPESLFGWRTASPQVLVATIVASGVLVFAGIVWARRETK